MVQSNRNAVVIVAILAIVILVGIVAWFIREERDSSTIEVDLGLQAQVMDEAVPTPATPFMASTSLDPRAV